MHLKKSIMLIFLAFNSCAIPPLRGETSFPKAEIYKRIKCELYKAVSNIEDAQKLAYPKSEDKFILKNYGATLVLVEKSSENSGLSVGGSSQGLDKERAFTLGSSPFPGFGASYNNSLYDSSKRQILFADILKDKHRQAIPGRDMGFLTSCDATTNPSKYALPIGQPLGITARLTSVLKEAVSSPGAIDEEEMYFDFAVTLGAGGTFTFTEPTRGISLGAGSSRTFNETLKITMTRIDQKSGK